MHRLLIDVTHTANHNSHTGIQRVVRCLAHEAMAYSECGPIECLPVVHVNGQFVRVDQACIARGFRKSFPRSKVLSKNVVPAWLNVLLRLDYLRTRARKLLYPRTIDRNMRKFIQAWRPTAEMAVQPRLGDVILLPDSWWDMPEMFDAIQRARQDGALVGAMIYDLIPIQFPEFVVEGAHVRFSEWIKRLIHTVDFMFGDAKVAEDDLRNYIAEQGAPLADWQVGHIRLGCDITSKADVMPSRISRGIRSIFNDRQTAPYLMVSTLEVRKNHHYLIDAFDLLWKEGNDVSLAFVGQIGWKCDDLIRRITHHPELGRRLHLLTDVDDATLNVIYKKSKACLFSSKAEGFGLPIVEAMHHGLNVFASDIPILREVGGEGCRYFPLDDPSYLARQIKQFEEERGWQSPVQTNPLNEPWSAVFPKLVKQCELFASRILESRQEKSRSVA